MGNDQKDVEYFLQQKQVNFWRLVELTLENVFHMAPIAVSEIKEELSSASKIEQLLFYHSEALSVASNIASKIPNNKHVEQYKRLREQVYADQV